MLTKGVPIAGTPAFFGGTLEGSDNTATVLLAGRLYTLEASLGACKVYSDEFRGVMEKPYVGSLWQDMLTLYRQVSAMDDDALDMPSVLFAITWAMGRASGSIEEPWEKWERSISHANIGFYEVAGLYSAVINDLANRVVFREPGGPADAEEPDAKQV